MIETYKISAGKYDVTIDVISHIGTKFKYSYDNNFR